MTFIKKGRWGQNFMKTNFFFAIVTLGGVELCMIQFPSLNFSIFNQSFRIFMKIFSIFPIFGQIKNNMVSIFSKLDRFYSIFVEINHFFEFFCKIMFIFIERGGGRIFIFLSLFLMSQLPQGAWGQS